MISDKVLKEFNIQGKGVELDGGQATSQRYGDIVIKPVDEEEYANYSSSVFYDLEPEGYRISKPLKSISDKFVVEGYLANKYEPGEHDFTRIEDMIAVSNKLHADLRKLHTKSIPDFNNPWAKAQSNLWRGNQLPQYWEYEVRKLCSNLIKDLKPLGLPYQLIHSDLSGNVLFHDTLQPLIIDFSPAYAPYEYANALIVCDNIAWGDLKLESIELLKPHKLYKEVIKYAVAFRVLTTAYFNEASIEGLRSEWANFKSIWDYVSD